MRRKGLLSEIMLGLGGQASMAPNIDYPRPGDIVWAGHYAIRISGCKGECQVAIDEGAWLPCRVNDGFHWFDWDATAPGRHRIMLRAKIGNKWFRAQRSCEVK